MAISFPGVGAAAGSIGQMLMAKALQDREREDRASERKDITDLRREQVLSSRLGALGATGDAFLPYTPGMKPPETAEPVNVMGESFFRVPKAPPAPTPTRGQFLQTDRGFMFGDPTQGTVAPITAPGGEGPLMPYRAPTQTAELPFGVSAGGISTRVATPEQAVKLRGQLTPPDAGGLPKLTEAQMRVVAQVPDVARGLSVVEEVVGEHGVPTLAEHGLARTPVIGQFFLPEEWQRFENAARLAGTAIVRWESGAAIRPNEVEETANKKYVPRPGDKPELVEQKLAALRDKFQTMTLMTPPAYLKELGVDPSQFEPAGAIGVPPQPQPSWQDRARELKAQGLAPDDVIATLRSEGLIQ